MSDERSLEETYDLRSGTSQTAEERMKTEAERTKELQWEEVGTTSTTSTSGAGLKKPLGKASIYDLADAMGSTETVTTTKTELLLDETERQVLANGGYRVPEEGERVRGEIQGRTEHQGREYWAVHAVDRDRETDRVLVPAGEREYQRGDTIRAEMGQDTAYIVDYSQGRSL